MLTCDGWGRLMGVDGRTRGAEGKRLRRKGRNKRGRAERQGGYSDMGMGQELIEGPLGAGTARWRGFRTPSPLPHLDKHSVDTRRSDLPRLRHAARVGHRPQRAA